MDGFTQVAYKKRPMHAVHWDIYILPEKDKSQGGWNQPKADLPDIQYMKFTRNSYINYEFQFKVPIYIWKVHFFKAVHLKRHPNWLNHKQTPHALLVYLIKIHHCKYRKNNNSWIEETKNKMEIFC